MQLNIKRSLCLLLLGLPLGLNANYLYVQWFDAHWDCQEQMRVFGYIITVDQLPMDIVELREMYRAIDIDKAVKEHGSDDNSEIGTNGFDVCNSQLDTITEKLELCKYNDLFTVLHYKIYNHLQERFKKYAREQDGDHKEQSDDLPEVSVDKKEQRVDSPEVSVGGSESHGDLTVEDELNLDGLDEELDLEHERAEFTRLLEGIRDALPKEVQGCDSESEDESLSKRQLKDEIYHQLWSIERYLEPFKVDEESKSNSSDESRDLKEISREDLAKAFDLVREKIKKHKITKFNKKMDALTMSFELMSISCYDEYDLNYLYLRRARVLEMIQAMDASLDKYEQQSSS